MTEKRPATRQPMTFAEPRAVRKARLRSDPETIAFFGLDRTGRRAAKARGLLSAFDARRAEDRAIGARLVAADRFRRAGTMPHVPSGKHQKKLAQRKEARRSAVSAALR